MEANNGRKDGGTMTFLWGVLIFWSDCFVGMIGAAFIATARDADEYEAHTDFSGEK